MIFIVGMNDDSYIWLEMMEGDDVSNFSRDETKSLS